MSDQLMKNFDRTKTVTQNGMETNSTTIPTKVTTTDLKQKNEDPILYDLCISPTSSYFLAYCISFSQIC